MANKALIIDLKQGSERTSSPGSWATLDNIQDFTKSIKTPPIDENADKGAIVSGVPTVFARANMFATAISYLSGGESGTSGMMSFYEDLISEWKGLLACLALEPNRITVNKVELSYSDGKPKAETGNLYEPKGAFGNMLFERAPIWKEQGDDNIERNPFINIIKYNGQVVGGTSPESLLFTASGYYLEKNDAPFIRNGKFADPLKIGQLDDESRSPLFAYVNNLIQKLSNEFAAYYKVIFKEYGLSFDNVIKLLEGWREEIKSKMTKDPDEATPNPCNEFTAPFDMIFNYSDKWYGFYDGIIYSKQNEKGQLLEFKAEDLLLNRNNDIARIILPKSVKYEELPVWLLDSNIKGCDEKAYFALPLSEIGLKIFWTNMDALLHSVSDEQIKSHLETEYDEAEQKLKVTLKITTEDGKTKRISINYAVKDDNAIRNVDVLLWPNFISKQWKRYFLYSEMPIPRDGSSSRFYAVPFVGEQREDIFIPVYSKKNELVYVTAKDDLKEEVKLSAKPLVVSDHRVGQYPYKYEIYESNLPYAGVKIASGVDKEGNERVGGFLMVRYSSNSNSALPKDWLSKIRDLKGVDLGFDFGSTNSSVAYFDKNADDNQAKAKGIVFNNRRVSFFGEGALKGPQPKDFLFFPSDVKRSNMLKSVLAIHDPKRLPQNDNRLLKSPISGGVPCFKSNLPIRSVSDNIICLEFRNGAEIQLVNNMKWQTGDGALAEQDQAYKMAYLKTIMLMVYAELFELNYRPKKLNWSYPSSMEDSVVRDHYGPVWASLCEENESPLYDVSMERNFDFVVEEMSKGKSSFSDSGPVMFSDSEKKQTEGSNQFMSNVFGASSSYSPSTESDGFYDPFMSGASVPVKKVEEEPEKCDLNLTPDADDVFPSFDNVVVTKPMSEAEASANYTANTYDTSKELVLSFDIGGSTSDISALFMIDGKTTMLKQSSIHFAAQNIAKATKYMYDDFYKVLMAVCEKNNLKLYGLNEGDSRYDSSTAPYYYEQIVDILDAEGLKGFYKSIAEKCPKLLAVNMYVTGLIMFYAGQLSNSLYHMLKTKAFADRAKGNEVLYNCINFKNNDFKFRPIFEGKGARIFDWLGVINPQLAQSYFKAMFKQGTGLAESLCDDRIDLSQLDNHNSSEVKFEVSMGLAHPCLELRVPQKTDSFEIFGEKGFVGYGANGKKENYDFVTKIRPEWMEVIGNKILQSGTGCECFKVFCGTFFLASSEIVSNLHLKMDEFEKGFRDMNITQYIAGIPEYRKAKEKVLSKTGKFDFVAPIIILEGIKFYDEHLMNCFAKS